MVKKSVKIEGKGIPFDIDETLDKAFQKYLQKTGAKASPVIRIALEDFIINRAHETIPRLSARVEAKQIMKDYKEAGQLMKLVMSSGYGNFNLQQAYEKIERMPIVEKQKEEIREIAKFYDAFKRNGGSKVVKLIKTAYPSIKLGEKTREDKFLVAMHRYYCKGCFYIGKDEHCKKYCKKFRALLYGKSRKGDEHNG